MNHSPSRRFRRSTVSSKSRTFSASKGAGWSGSNRSRSTGVGRQARSGGRKHAGFDVSRYINHNPAKPARVETYQPQHQFSDLNLKDPFLRNLGRADLTAPTPIQDQVIPLILKRQDVVGVANTGTGKTAAFLIPLIDLTLRESARQTLILTPTRELAVQIEAELRKLAVGLNLSSAICIGGAGIQAQIKVLRRPNHFIIGTPGRILDLIGRQALKLDHIRSVVLDEADRMLDMGFIKDVRAILAHTPESRETHCFSATMLPEIESLIRDFLKQPQIISVKKQDITRSVSQDVVRHKPADKFETLTNLLQRSEFARVLVFGEMKHQVEKLSRDLSRAGLKATSIHGNKSHAQRQRALRSFKDGSARVLVATDVAARGLHISDVTHVINYDLPATYEDYIHRIGRTGRADRTGQALTFVSQ